MVNVRNEIATAKTWAASHVVAAFVIGIALGAFLYALLF